MSDSAIRRLIDACEAYLRGLDHHGANDVLEGIGRWKDGPPGDLAPGREPGCGGLDAAITAIDGAPDLKAAVAAARPALRWVTYGAYDGAAIGPRFPKAHAFVSLIGGDGHVRGGDFELGLFLILPRTLYRDHHHPAPELYAPLTGPHFWRFGPASPWVEKRAHEPVWNPPWSAHATLVKDVPFLCLFGWTGDVNSPAKLVPAADWPMLEAGL
jgi:hypothetical protein